MQPIYSQKNNKICLSANIFANILSQHEESVSAGEDGDESGGVLASDGEGGAVVEKDLLLVETLDFGSRNNVRTVDSQKRFLRKHGEDILDRKSTRLNSSHWS